jgi:hypothetical protein
MLVRKKTEPVIHGLGFEFRNATANIHTHTLTEGGILMLSEEIVGVWELQVWETIVDDKVIGYPLGEKAFGFIAYHPVGFMSVNISAPNRLRLASDDPFGGDPKLLALDAKGYLSYCGPFSVVSEN